MGSGPAQQTAPDAAFTQRLAPLPRDRDLWVLPLRHHSPACAWQLRRLIRQLRPQCVLIEGPADASALLPWLGHASARPPLAVYACRTDTAIGERAARAFYPLAPFSPEWIALREGRRCGAEVAFMDRPAAALLQAQIEDVSESPASADPLDEAEPSLLCEHGLGTDARMQRVVEASGCEDFDHWWDRHFEAGAQRLAPADYFLRLQQWCLLLRDRPRPEQCSLRERAMAAHIAAARARGLRTLAVCGGLHVEAIAVLLTMPEPPKIEPPDPRAACFLVPYNLQRLDRAQDYAAGLPDTGYYHQLWQALERGEAEPQRAAAEAAVLHVLAGLRKDGHAAGLPDAIEAVRMSVQLASLRDTPPGRAEVLDALAGALPIAHGRSEQARRRQLRSLLARDCSGALPRNYPRAPLVEDFRRRAKALGLSLLPGADTRPLDLYRSEKHRAISRLLHQLRLLDAPYAELRAGPDFIQGEGLQRVRETWQIGWQPEVDARLTECLHYGAQLPEAAMGRLLEQARRQPSEAARFLLEGLRAGLHSQMEPLLKAVDLWAQRCGDLPALCRSLAQLASAERARAVLASTELAGLRSLLGRVYARAVALLPWLGQMETERAREHIEALSTLNSLAAESWADLPALLDALTLQLDASMHELLRGRVAGILCARARLTGAAATQRLRAALDAGLLHPEAMANFLLGFLPMARHVLIGDANLITAFNHALLDWDEELFLQLLPGLRLAFTALKPQEACGLLRALVEPAARGEAETLDLDADALAALHELRAETTRIAALWGLHD